MKGLLWYSAATDITGEKLANDLGLEKHSSRELPDLNGIDFVICWGCKTNRDYNFDIPVLNHPNKIRFNRNKFKSTARLAEGDNHGPLTKEVFTELTREQLNSGRWIGRTKYHQGGKGLWLVLNEDDYEYALRSGAKYFQRHLDIKNEYRYHIFGDECIYAVKKTMHEDPIRAWKSVVKEALERKMELPENIDAILDVAVKTISLPDRIIRSNKRGWKFTRVNRINNELKSKAVRAVKALGLDFGAVDLVTTLSGDVWVLEVNTGPGLKRSPYEAWKSAFENYINNLERNRGNNRNGVVRERLRVEVDDENIAPKVDMEEVANKIEGLVVSLDFSNVSEEDKKKMKKVKVQVY